MGENEYIPIREENRPSMEDRARALGIDPTGKSEQEVVGAIVEFRKKQGIASRLAEYVTGFRIMDPKLAERMAEDHYAVRQKYGLPDRAMRFESSSDYELLLREKAKAVGVRIVDRSECGTFFQENSIAGAVYDDKERKMGVTVKKDGEQREYLQSLLSIEHELIHGMQHQRYPSFPTEVMEYEAYVAGFNPKYMRDNPDEAGDITFGFFVLGSVSNWYKNVSLERGEEVKPEWDDPNYFLEKVDGIRVVKEEGSKI